MPNVSEIPENHGGYSCVFSSPLIMKETVLEEENLWDAIREGDQEAFTVLYKRFWYPMYRVAYRKLNKKEAAEEIIQEIFTRLWKDRKNLTIEHLDRYLFSAVRYEVIDFYRANPPLAGLDEVLCPIGEIEDTNTESTILMNDLMENIDRGLMILPEKSRDIFKLHRFENWPIPKIAIHFSITEKTVEYHLTKSLKYIRTYLTNTLILLSVPLLASLL